MWSTRKIWNQRHSCWPRWQRQVKALALVVKTLPARAVASRLRPCSQQRRWRQRWAPRRPTPANWICIGHRVCVKSHHSYGIHFVCPAARKVSHVTNWSTDPAVRQSSSQCGSKPAIQRAVACIHADVRKINEQWSCAMPDAVAADSHCSSAS